MPSHTNVLGEHSIPDLFSFAVGLSSILLERLSTRLWSVAVGIWVLLWGQVLISGDEVRWQTVSSWASHQIKKYLGTLLVWLPNKVIPGPCYKINITLTLNIKNIRHYSYPLKTLNPPHCKICLLRYAHIVVMLTNHSPDQSDQDWFSHKPMTWTFQLVFMHDVNQLVFLHMTSY